MRGMGSTSKEPSLSIVTYRRRKEDEYCGPEVRHWYIFWGCERLFIEEIALALLFEGREIGLPPLRNLSRVFLVFQRPHRIHVRNQMLCLCHREIRIKMMECTDQLNSQFRRIKRAPVCHRK